MIVFLVCLWGRPGVLRLYSHLCAQVKLLSVLRDHIGYQELNMVQPHSRKELYPLYSLDCSQIHYFSREQMIEIEIT